MSNLLNKLSEIDYLKNSWRKINKSNRDSMGLSQETIDQFEKNLNTRIEQIASSLKKSKYQFSPTKARLIPKKEKGKFRALKVPEIQDRIVSKGLAILIEDAFKFNLDSCRLVSFAYQKNQGVREATFTIRKLIEAEYKFVLEVDLKDFFGSVNTGKLLDDIIFKKLKDDSINNLIRSTLSQPTLGLEQINQKYHSKFTTKGLPQGNPLSPLLSNIYLEPFDRAMIKSNIKLVRYADDFVILTKTKKEANIALQKCENILEKDLNLEIHKEGDKKYKITEIGKNSFDFLSITHFKDKFTPSKFNIDKLIEELDSIWKTGVEKKSLQEILYKYKWKLDGWASAFYYSDISDYSSFIDWNINRYLLIAFNKLEFILDKKKLKKMPHKLRKSKGSNLCFNMNQRKNAGIPLITELWDSKKKQ